MKAISSLRNNSVRALVFLLSLTATTSLRADTIFVEAESFKPSSSGWRVVKNQQAQRASRATTLWGADGPGDSVATKTVSIRNAGKYRVWVRSMQVGAWRGPFRLSVSSAKKEAKKELAGEVFDLAIDPKVEDWEYGWHSFDVDLPAGDALITLSKHEQKNCVGYVRHVDCVLLTTDQKLVPNHIPHVPQTFVRVTLQQKYERPVYLHLFADHYRSPWYAHYAIGGDGLHVALDVPAGKSLKAGTTSPWCNLTETVYPDTGAALNFSIRHAYHDKAKRFRAKLEFGRSQGVADKKIQIVKAFDITAEPNGVVVLVPPDLETKEHIALLKRDRDYAEEIGRLADAFAWPTYGKRPEKIPFLVAASIGGYDLAVDRGVVAREEKTLNYFGFNGGHERVLGGLWHMLENSCCRPDIATMQRQVQQDVDAFKKSGRKLNEIAVLSLMDEPTGQAASFMAKDQGYREKFREWLQKQHLTPQDLLLKSWDEVRPVVETERAQFPALHYYTQLFRTRAIGDFLGVQRQIIEKAYGRTFPTVVNFSDGAVYHANFCSQGIDYFELLDADNQNGIWGEDWANNSSTFQCGSYNVALMQAAARKRQQTIGHYLIAHAGRSPWDIKTKAISETARGVRIWQNFCYGTNWGSHEGGPAATSHLWHGRPEVWQANAEVSREIGAVEDWLLTAKPAPADVAILYSSASDIWTINTSFADGFDRMHTWLALTHAQVPVDILPEREFDQLSRYKVCYLSGPNLTRAAAARLRDWVTAGGTLWLAAGAASRDEYNRPLDTLTTILPAARGELQTLDAFQSSGRFLNILSSRDQVTWGTDTLPVFSVKQSLKPFDKTAAVLATFQDKSPAVIGGRAGKGNVIVCGFLPALGYIKAALAARLPLEEKAAEQQRLADDAKLNASLNADQPEATNATASSAPLASAASGLPAATRELLNRSYNPWQFPEGVRNRLLTPVRDAKLQPRVTCDKPLVDVVALPCDQGLLIALSNFSLQPTSRLQLSVGNGTKFQQAESVRHGVLKFTRDGDKLLINLPLDATDFVTIH